MEVPPPEELKQPLVVPYKLLMGPGPSNPPPRVMNALTHPILGHMHEEMFQIMDDIKKGIQYVFQTKSKLTLALSASGHSGMEAIFSNLIEPGDRVLVLVNGYWGQRASDIAKRHGAQVKTLVQIGDTFSIITIDNAIQTFRPKLLFIIHGETSTGVCQPLEGIGEITKRYNCLLAVDTVASLAAVPFKMDAWKIDVAYTGSQKMLQAPAGITPIAFSDRAQHVIFTRKSEVPVYYVDMKILGRQWGCFDSSRTYHHTTCSSLLYALREALALAVEEGLENRIEKQKFCAQKLYEGLQNLGFEFYVEEEYKRLPSVTTVKVPQGINSNEVVAYVMKKFHIDIQGGLGPTAGKVFRIGIMGYNTTPEKVAIVLEALKDALHNCRKSKF
ncbi:hypothetical protein ABEB36_011985 [Hypothenemus hampei]|uniref:Alanine--glyoxylate aminotransferase n=1 Tax=Hypothenemus hampei TaxID=57062 RepID=A0ABD1E9N8_HYPHA